MNGIAVVLLTVAVLLQPGLAQTPSDDAGSASAQIDDGHYRAALDALAPLIEQQPGNADLRALRGRAELGLHQNEAAATSFRDAIRYAPDNGRYHYLLGQALAKIIPDASVISRPSLATELREAYEKSVKLSPGLIPAHEALMDFYLQAPGFFGGSLDSARQQAAVIARLDPGRGLRAKAVIAASQGSTGVAIQDYLGAIRLRTHDAGLRLDLGELYLKLNHPHEACELFQQVLKLAPDNVEALEQLGQAAPQSGQEHDLLAGADALERLSDKPPDGMSLTPQQVKDLLRRTRSMLQASR